MIVYPVLAIRLTLDISNVLFQLANLYRVDE